MGQTKEAGRNKMVIRPFKDEDREEIKQLFIKGTMEGPGSPYIEAMEAFRPYYIAATMMLILAGSFSFANLGLLLDRHLGVFSEGISFDSDWIGLLYGASAGLYLYAFLRRIALTAFLGVFMAGGLQDLGDIPYTYDLKAPSSTDSPFYVSKGPGGFWVAEKDGRIAGFVGLKTSKNPSNSPRVWIVSRLIVAQNQRGHGIARLLMDALYAHARSHSLPALELITSTFFNTAANRMYERDGFMLVRKIMDSGERLKLLRKVLE